MFTERVKIMVPIPFLKLKEYLQGKNFMKDDLACHDGAQLGQIISSSWNRRKSDPTSTNQNPSERRIPELTPQPVKSNNNRRQTELKPVRKLYILSWHNPSFNLLDRFFGLPRHRG
jgi:hypothetical protein